jgi:hypothetical protein
MRYDDRSFIVAKAAEALETSVGLILNSDGSEEEKRQELVETFTQFQTYLDRNVAGKRMGKGVLEREQRRTREAFEKIFAAKAADYDGDDVAKADRDRHVGHHNLAAAVTEHALDRLARLRECHGFSKGGQPEKESAMSSESLESIFKDYGAAKGCKHIVAEGKTGYSEFELVSALTKHASEQHPELRPDVAFAKLYESEESVRRACQVAKATFAEAVLGPGMTPQVVTGADARDVDDPQAALDAYARLQEIGKARWPDASEAIQFSNAFTDPKNAALAAKAHRRPAPTTFFPMPR